MDPTAFDDDPSGIRGRDYIGGTAVHRASNPSFRSLSFESRPIPMRSSDVAMMELLGNRRCRFYGAHWRDCIAAPSHEVACAPQAVIAGAVGLSAVVAVGGVATLSALGHHSSAPTAFWASPGLETKLDMPRPPARPTGSSRNHSGAKSAGAVSRGPGTGERTGSPAPSHAPGTSAPTQTSTASPTHTPNPAPSDGIIHTDGQGHLTLNGKRYQFVGVWTRMSSQPGGAPTTAAALRWTISAVSSTL